MAHTISKQVYSETEKKYIECEILVLDEDENLPETDRREIILSCASSSNPLTAISDEIPSDIEDLYPETELIDQYEGFDNR